MSRLKIELPDIFLYSTEIVVQVSHLNYGNHLGHDALISILHEARVRFFRQGGFSEMDVGGAGIMVADLAVTYLQEAFHGDELRIDIAVENIAGASADLFYRVMNSKTGLSVAAARTRVTFFSALDRKPVRVPAEFKQFLGNIR